MRHVVCCWAADSTSLERHVPLLFVARRSADLGYSTAIDLVFLEGLATLDRDYREQLERAGYRLHDGSRAYRAVKTGHGALGRFNEYERKCFLRWLVLAELFPAEPFVHWDGDIVFNEDPRVVAELLAGKTFVLQGCPGFTCVADVRWLDDYHRELERFCADVDGYSARAWREREGWQRSETERWAGQRSREVISSDQDLVSHLIHTGRLRQELPVEILGATADYVMFDNPLYLHGYELQLQHAHYQRRAGVDYVGEKRVLFWHMQADFSRYLSRFLFRHRLGLWRGKRLLNDLETPSDFERRLYGFYERRIDRTIGWRRTIYQYFFADHDFSGVLTDDVWWKPGAFA